MYRADVVGGASWVNSEVYTWDRKGGYEGWKEMGHEGW